MRASPYHSFLLLLGFLTFSVGCTQQTGTVTKASTSALVFVGDSANIVVSVDGRSFALSPKIAKNHFEVSPGVHRVTIMRDAAVVVDREILLSDRQTMEIRID
jgi:hypothetical protein